MGSARASAALPSASAALPEAPAAPELLGRAVDVPAGAKACGPLRCMEFATATNAFRAVLEKNPRVLGVGEAHALKGSEGVSSSTARFTSELLPELKGKASDLLLELWFPNPKCRPETVKQVQKQQEVVTKKQAATNKNEYVELGNRAKRLGLMPRSLQPSCEDLDAITRAGSNDIGLMLETVAKYTEQDIKALLKAQTARNKPSMILAYGGAMHNDPYPKLGAESWSFGPALGREVDYVALDLIVPEYIKDTPVWRSMPWHAAYTEHAKANPGHLALLFELRPREFVLIFPPSPQGKPPNKPG